MDTEAALCVNCHMPGSYYMVNDFRRDHSFRVPRPDQSVLYGTPNACVNCHSDKDNEWASAKFTELYGAVDSVHFSDKLAPGIQLFPNGDKGLLELIRDTHENDFVRASAVKALEGYDVQYYMNEYLKLLKDESGLVRGASVEVLGNINSTSVAKHLFPLLKDPKRTVRVKTFYALGGVKPNEIPDEYKEYYNKVQQEFLDAVETNADFVGGLVRKANYEYKKGNIQKTIDLYKQALEMDDLNNNLRMSLANFYYELKDYPKTIEYYEKIIQTEANPAPAYYSLGLLYAELNQPEKAIQNFKKTIQLNAQNTRAYYNLGLLYSQKGDTKQAEKVLLNGLTVNPNDVDVLYALTYLYINNNQLEEAKKYSEKLVQIAPNNPDFQNIYQQLLSQ